MQLATQLKLEMEMEMKTRNEKQPSRKLSECRCCQGWADWPELLLLLLSVKPQTTMQHRLKEREREKSRKRGEMKWKTSLGQGLSWSLFLGCVWAVLVGLLPGRSCSKKFKVSAEITLTSWSCDRQRQRQPYTVAAQGKQRQRVYNEITRAHATKAAAAAAAGARASQGPALHKVNLSFVKPLQEMGWWWLWWLWLWLCRFVIQICWLRPTR